MICAFVLIPFSYFYFEAFDPINDSTGRRFWNAFKFSAGFLLCVIILFIIGLVVKPGIKPDADSDLKEWAKDLFDTANRGEGAISFVIACLTLLGYLAWMTFTAYGLSALPIGLIKGKLSANIEKAKYDREIINARNARQTTAKRGYLSRADEDRASLLKDTERKASVRAQRVEEETGGWRKILIIFRPFAFIFGIVFLLLSVLIIISIMLTNIDKVMQDYCGAKCGYFLQYGRKLFNPLDSLMVLLSKFFPIDYIVYGCVILYIFFCTVSGVTRIGIRILCIKMFPFRKSGTAPQGLLCAAWVLILSVLALNNQLITLTPQYATYGSQEQHFVNKSEVPCSLEWVTNGTCRMTVIGRIVNRVNVGMPFFGVCFYWMTWGFLLCYLIGLIFAICRGKASNIEEYSDDELNEEDMHSP